MVLDLPNLAPSTGFSIWIGANVCVLLREQHPPQIAKENISVLSSWKVRKDTFS